MRSGVEAAKADLSAAVQAFEDADDRGDATAASFLGEHCNAKELAFALAVPEGVADIKAKLSHLRADLSRDGDSYTALEVALRHCIDRALAALDENGPDFMVWIRRAIACTETYDLPGLHLSSLLKDASRPRLVQ